MSRWSVSVSGDKFSDGSHVGSCPGAARVPLPQRVEPGDFAEERTSELSVEGCVGVME